MDRILIVDDEFLIRYTLEEGLKDRGYDAYSAATVEEGLEFVRKYHPGVLLLDNLLENSVGMDEIVNFKNADEELQVIMMTAYGSVSQAVEATKRGAYDYILKPFDVDEIDMLIKRCLEQKRNRDSLVFLKGDVPQFLGVSEAAARIRHLIQVLGENLSVNVLLRGETGTGKEVVARQIHANSARKDNLMVRINCGAIPENLMESELFGYERGAFAGALKTKKGLIELADGGTVFLDEIGELPMAMQTKLLTFLDDRKFKRIGALEDTAVDVRIIAATNRNLEEAIKAGQFREDLFYRLNVMQIEIPPLRDRYVPAHRNQSFLPEETAIRGAAWKPDDVIIPRQSVLYPLFCLCFCCLYYRSCPFFSVCFYCFFYLWNSFLHAQFQHRPHPKPVRTGSRIDCTCFQPDHIPCHY